MSTTRLVIAESLLKVLTDLHQAAMDYAEVHKDDGGYDALEKAIRETYHKIHGNYSVVDYVNHYTQTFVFFRNATKRLADLEEEREDIPTYDILKRGRVENLLTLTSWLETDLSLFKAAKGQSETVKTNCDVAIKALLELDESAKPLIEVKL